MSENVHDRTLSASEATTRDRALAAIAAAALGIVVVFAAGFAPGDAVHNAAHDSRHSFAFPCH